MSTILYIREQAMSFEEKSTWIYGALAVTLPVIYFATIVAYRRGF
jgi:hypothetical protein